MRFKFPSELMRFRVLVRNQKIEQHLKSNKSPKLHIGCGSNHVAGWLNADKFNSAADIYLNVYKKMPFKGNTFNYLYSEHTLEHLNITKVKFFLEECLRVLKPGGMFRITVPDLELLATKYVEKDNSFFAPYLEKYEPMGKTGKQKFWMVRSPGGVLNLLGTKHFFNHRWFYDFETLKLCCEEVGFRKVSKQSFGRSDSEVLSVMDLENRNRETLYVEMSK